MAKRTPKRAPARKPARAAAKKTTKVTRRAAPKRKANVRKAAPKKVAAKRTVKAPVRKTILKKTIKAPIAKPKVTRARRPAAATTVLARSTPPVPTVTIREPAPTPVLEAATEGPTASSLELVVHEIEASLAGVTKEEALDNTVDVLAQVAHYNWVGIYLLDGDTLVLGPFRGAETEHVRIPIGQGICGLAARTAATVNVPDVNKDPRYLSCFLNTRSELVVPVFDPEGRVVGEIDIDSDTANAFTQVDESVVERVARLLTPFFAAEPAPEKEPERFIGTN